MLQRIYGTAWASKKELEAHLHRLEEAAKRDHRKLGAELDLFSLPRRDRLRPGGVPPQGRHRAPAHGGLLPRQRHEEAGYEFVYSPHITKSNLFETCGHLDWYADGMYPPMELRRRGRRGQDYYLKPMNCPFHILIYKSRQRSYRELPLRLFEFGTVYRYEKSGVVHGLTRVRGLHAGRRPHLHAPRSRWPRSSRRCSTSCSTCCATTASTTSTSSCPPSRRARRSAPTRSGTRPPRRCARSLERKDLELVLDEGGGAFYGPKISRAGHATPSAARGRCRPSSSTSSCRSASSMEYVGADNERHRPIMIHRALFGSVERFFAVLVEHYAGAFPAWLAPVQVRVLPVRDDHDAYADRIVDRLQAEGFRADAGRGQTSSSATASARPSARSCRTCSWWATTTSRRHRRREPPRRRGRARRARRRLRRAPRGRGVGEA